MLDSTVQGASNLIKIITSKIVLISKSYNCVGVKKIYNKIHKLKHDKPTLLIKSVWLFT